MKKLIVIIIVLLLSGCMNPRVESEKSEERYGQKERSNQTEQMINKKIPEATGNTHNKDYYQSDEKGIATDGTEMNFFATDETREIAQLLSRRIDIRQSQVVSLQDRVVITLMTNPNKMTNETISSITDDVQKMVPTKQVLIYTDENQWNRMKDLDSSLSQRKIGESMEEFVERYFNVEVKD